MAELFLYQKIDSVREFGAAIPEIPNFILDNLSQAIKLRDYQRDAIQNTLLYLQSNSLSNNKQTHLLYHMATGSGKTVVMAMNILYYYAMGYRKFLFFTNQTSIVNKTKINFTDKTSSKFLFADNIVINGRNVGINIVDNFQNVNEQDINICFATTSGLHGALWNFQRENSLTLEDFENDKIVFLADEAHHLNSLTKNSEKEDVAVETSWEYTISRLLYANRDNVLLEYTATCNLKDPNVLRKYLDKIVYNFTLKEFREAGYTKEFSNFSSNVDVWTRTLQALLMSEYRKLLFEKHNIQSKPVVMLKSKEIKDSKKFYEIFYEKLNSLQPSEINQIKLINSSSGDSRFINNAFAFFEHEEISIDNIVDMLKLDFAKEYSILMNSNENNEELYHKVNTLDDKDNKYRLIFTVAKLTEGWDVLSLFDIVRLYDSRQGGHNGKPSDFTISEAQLIGRGARYFPFSFNESQNTFKKKYDNDIENPEAICETLLYHCLNDSQYISELKQALKYTGFEPDEKIDIKYVLKDSFKKTNIYQTGYIFLNDRKEKSRKEIKSLPDKIRLLNVSHVCSGGSTVQGLLFDDKKQKNTLVDLPPLKLKEIEQNISYKAYRMFYSTLAFNLLKNKFPNLKSQNEFIYSDDYLGSVTITFSLPNGGKLTNDDKLKACEKIFEIVSNYVQKVEVEYEGTKEFTAHLIRDVIPSERTKQISKDRIDTDSYGEGISQNDYRVSEEFRFDVSSKDWYAFDDNKGTSEEKKFVAYFNTIVDELKQKYEEVYLIRNELFVSVYSFKNGDRFEPDYVLILKENNKSPNQYMCVFIEPKGEHLMAQDKWKEDFLLEMSEYAMPIKKWADDNEYKIWGLPFFNNDLAKSKFNDYLKKNLLD